MSWLVVCLLWGVEVREEKEEEEGCTPDKDAMRGMMRDAETKKGPSLVPAPHRGPFSLFLLDSFAPWAWRGRRVICVCQPCTQRDCFQSRQRPCFPKRQAIRSIATAHASLRVCSIAPPVPLSSLSAHCLCPTDSEIPHFASAKVLCVLLPRPFQTKPRMPVLFERTRPQIHPHTLTLVG